MLGRVRETGRPENLHSHKTDLLIDEKTKNWQGPAYPWSHHKQGRDETRTLSFLISFSFFISFYDIPRFLRLPSTPYVSQASLELVIH